MKGAAPAAAVLLVRGAASAAVLASGFRAVSDDDYARAVIAEQWARAPRWDASGTSWLPFPFWVTGAAMKLAGRDLVTARVVAVILGLGAALLLYLAARWLGETPAAAGAAAVAASLFPWSARLGVATVPELVTAALVVLSLATLASIDDGGRRRLLGGLALLAATLSRYETWPAALAFAGLSALDARTAGGRSGKAPLLGAAALAIAGPLAWAGWNHVAHGDALHFLARVTAYRQALGGAEGGAAERLWAYPLAIAREEPEVVALFVAALAVTAAAGGVAALRARLAPYARPAAVAAVQVAALSLAMIKDGAPTHHPERAVLAEMLVLAMIGGALAARALASGAPRRPLALGAIAGAVALVGWLGRSARPLENFALRRDEEAIGAAAAGMCPPGERALIEVTDYGYLAVTAALGRPEDAIPDRSVDPRDPRRASSFADPAELGLRVATSGARWVVARPDPPAREALGAPLTERGAWALFRAGAAP